MVTRNTLLLCAIVFIMVHSLVYLCIQRYDSTNNFKLIPDFDNLYLYIKTHKYINFQDENIIRDKGATFTTHSPTETTISAKSTTSASTKSTTTSASTTSTTTTTSTKTTKIELHPQTKTTTTTTTTTSITSTTTKTTTTKREPRRQTKTTTTTTKRAKKEQHPQTKTTKKPTQSCPYPVIHEKTTILATEQITCKPNQLSESACSYVTKEFPYNFEKHKCNSTTQGEETIKICEFQEMELNFKCNYKACSKDFEDQIYIFIFRNDIGWYKRQRPGYKNSKSLEDAVLLFAKQPRRLSQDFMFLSCGNDPTKIQLLHFDSGYFETIDIPTQQRKQEDDKTKGKENFNLTGIPKPSQQQQGINAQVKQQRQGEGRIKIGKKDGATRVQYVTTGQNKDNASKAKDTKSDDQNNEIIQRKLNINIVWLDSISRRHFYRSLPRTVETMDQINRDAQTKAEILDFELMQSVHGHTHENLIALTQGKVK